MLKAALSKDLSAADHPLGILTNTAPIGDFA